MKFICRFILVVAICFRISPGNSQDANSQDSLELVKFYNNTNGPGWTNHSGWLSGPVNLWYGVSLDVNGRVTAIFLRNNQLAGTIANLNLPNLQYLYLDKNQLSGGIPSFALPNLTDLWLADNQLTGSIPDFNLPNLYHLSLTGNQLTGNIPNFNFPNLIWLFLNNNLLTGSIPDFNLQSLQILSLFQNQLTGSIPNFNLPNLRDLRLVDNRLTGNIPNFDLPKLQNLSANNNLLTGDIPNFNLPVLTYLSFYNNKLTGNIPNFNLPKLQSLQLSLNQLTGNIPNFDLPELQEINLFLNNLTGSIPNFNLPKLSWLRLSGNKLSDSIPDFNLPNIQYLLLENNKLTGRIPSSIANLVNLKWLFLQFNQLSGNIPSLTTLSHLDSAIISYNKFTFAGLEPLVQLFDFIQYFPQSNIHLNNRNNVLFASAGGTLSNNTYTWYRNNQLYATIVGDSTLTATEPGKYHVWVTNSIAKALTLKSDTTEPLLFKMIDPNPSFITNNGMLKTNLSDLDKTKIVEGAVTDGTTKVLLYCNSTSPIRLWISNTNDGGLSGLENQITTSTETTIQPVNGEVVAVYNAPDGFGTPLSNQTSRQITIKAALINSTDSILINLTLVTPPVVMVHGMWSGPSVWVAEGFTPFLRSKGFQNIFLANYRNRNSETFNPNNPKSRPGLYKVEQEIKRALNYYRNNLKIAVTQADIVGHSLGGLMVRSVSQLPTFINLTNYNKGYIHKLITLGTPHKGSPFGPELWNNRNRPVIIGLSSSGPQLVNLSTAMAFTGQPIGSCHPDFGIESPGINAMKQTLSFKTFSVTADYSGQPAGLFAMDVLSRWAFNKPFSQVMGSRCPGNGMLLNDLIVPLNSQRGFVTGGKDTLFLNTAHSTPGGPTETKSPKIQDKVARLLLSDNTSQFGIGFPAPSSIPLDCNSASQRISNNSNGNRNNTIGAQAIQITSPTRGTTYQDGSNANIVLSFQPSGGAVPTYSMFMVEGIGWFPAPDQPPYTVNITLPPNSPIGKINILAMALDSSGLRLADTSHIFITPNGILDSLSVTPTNIILDSSIRESSLFVQGYFRNGTTIRIADLTNASTGTIYASQNNNVFTVNENGLVTAIGVGTDTLIITNGVKVLKLPVIVANDFQLSTYYSNAIDFPAISDKTIGDGPFGLSASSTSGDEVIFTVVSGPATIQNGILIMDTTGQITIKASQAGNVYFVPAQDVIRSFCLRPLRPAITKNCNVLSSNIADAIQWYKDGVRIDSATNQNLTIETTGIYTATVTSNGCQSEKSDSIIITPGSFPNTPILSATTPTTFCQGGTVTLSSSAATGNQWYKDGVAITDSVGTIYNATAGGSYTVKATVNGCESDASNAIVVTVNPIPSTPTITAGASTTFCTGGIVTLTSNAASGNQWFKDGVAISGSFGTTYNVSDSGSYTAKATVNGCESDPSNAIIVTVNTIPSIPTITQNGNQLTSSTTNGNQWYKDGVKVSGATGQNYTPTASGNYTVQVTVNNCTSAFSAAVNFIFTSVPDIDVFNNQVKVFPNPARDQLIITHSGALTGLNIRLFDINGKELKTISSGSSRIEIEMAKYASGVYIVWVEDWRKKIRGRKIIMKL